MQKKVREVMDACPPEIANDIVTVRDEVKNWASSLAPKDWNNGEAVSLKTKFCHFMRFGSNLSLLTETMEIGECLLQWSLIVKGPRDTIPLLQAAPGRTQEKSGFGKQNTTPLLDNEPLESTP